MSYERVMMSSDFWTFLEIYLVITVVLTLSVIEIDKLLKLGLK